MLVKYSPCHMENGKPTVIEKRGPAVLSIDGEEWDLGGDLQGIQELSRGKILEAFREGDELYVVVQRVYVADSDVAWDDGAWH